MAKSIPKVSGMDWVIDQLSQKAIEPDEFTVEMIIEKTKGTRSSTRHRLQRMCESGQITSRKVLLNGQFANIYKQAE